ncbi:uncharacterized protein [Palaemon carinicauda]|uniref:uncharacterized protein n=1 Tax=Palaemon carinicauda TaxID=392227 RepID=UPI0035B65928
MGTTNFIVVYTVTMIYVNRISSIHFSSNSSSSDNLSASFTSNNISLEDYSIPFENYTILTAPQKGNVTDSECSSRPDWETCVPHLDNNQTNEKNVLLINLSEIEKGKNVSEESDVRPRSSDIMKTVLKESYKVPFSSKTEESLSETLNGPTVKTIINDEMVIPSNIEKSRYEDPDSDFQTTNIRISLLESVETSSETYKFNITTTIADDEVTTQSDEVAEFENIDSDLAHMILCNSPPNKFSPEYKGNKAKECKSGDRVITHPFPEVMDMCQTVYGSIYPDAQPFDIGRYQLSEDSYLTMFYKEEFVQICSPLFERFDDCERRGFLTVCWNSGVAFARYSSCKIPSENDSHFFSLLTVFTLKNDTQCFEKVCEGIMRVVDSEVSGIRFRLMNSGTSSSENNSCADVYNGFDFVDNKENQDLFVTTNDHWPCCYALYMIVWVGNPEEKGISGSWDYLPYSCRVGEVALIIMVVLLSLSSVLGNLFIIVAMCSSKNRMLTTYMIRISLAIADLLKGLFIISPSLYDHAVPFFTPTEFTRVSPNMTTTSVANQSVDTITFENTSFITEGFLWFQGYLLTTCTIASLLSLFTLSVERFLMTKQNAEIRFYFTKGRVIALIVLFWVAGLADAILLSYDGERGFSIMYMKFKKIPLAYSTTYPDDLFYTIVHDVQFYMFYIIGLSTLVFSLLAFRNFYITDKRVRREWSELNMNVTGPYNEENYHIIKTMLVMTLFYLISVVPTTIDIFLHMANFTFRFTHLFSYLSWWCFLASSAWNPWIYNMRSKPFRLEVLHLIIKILPRKLKVRFVHFLQDPENE